MSLRRYVLKRLLLMIPVLFGVSVITFSLSALLPGNPVDYIIQFQDVSPETRAALEAQYHLNEPIWKRYLLWLQDAVTLDFGESVISDRSVTGAIMARLPATVLLGAIAFGIAILIAIPTGVLAAVNKGKPADEASRVFALFGVATPNFWLGLILILIFSVYLGWFPTIPPDQSLLSPSMLYFVILPAITLGTAQTAILMRLIRSSMVEELNKDYVQLARAKGLSKRTIVVKHVLRNSLISVVTVAALQIAFLVNGAVVIEQVFSWPGLGRLLLSSIFQRDFTILQATVLLIATIIVFANLLADVTYAWLDPRIRY